MTGLLAYIGMRKPETASKVDEGGRAFPVSAVIIALIIAVTVVIVVATMAEAVSPALLAAVMTVGGGSGRLQQYSTGGALLNGSCHDA